MYYSGCNNGGYGENDRIRCALSKTLLLDHPRNCKAISVLDIPWTERQTALQLWVQRCVWKQRLSQVPQVPSSQWEAFHPKLSVQRFLSHVRNGLQNFGVYIVQLASYGHIFVREETHNYFNWVLWPCSRSDATGRRYRYSHQAQFSCCSSPT